MQRFLRKPNPYSLYSWRIFAMQEYQFRGIQKSEWNNLFSFIQAKRLRIENVAEAEMGPSGAVRPALNIDLGEDIDTGMLQQSPSCLLMLQSVWHVSQEALLELLHMCMLSSKQAGLCINTCLPQAQACKHYRLRVSVL